LYSEPSTLLPNPPTVPVEDLGDMVHLFKELILPHFSFANKSQFPSVESMARN
jgi:hypothetical protein